MCMPSVGIGLPSMSLWLLDSCRYENANPMAPASIASWKIRRISARSASVAGRDLAASWPMTQIIRLFSGMYLPMLMPFGVAFMASTHSGNDSHVHGNAVRRACCGICSVDSMISM